MAATETSEILQAIREMEAEERAEAAELLGPHLPTPEAEFTRRQFGGILAAVAGGSLSVQAAMAAVNRGVMPAAAADGVVNDIDTLQSGDGSDISVQNALALADLLKLNNVSTSSSISTNGRQFIACDVSIASVTITLSSADQALGVPIIVFDSSANAGSNSINIDTEGSETIDGQGSIEISIDRGFELLFPDGSDWTTGRNFTAITTDETNITTTLGYAEADVTISSGSVSADAPHLNVAGEGSAADNLDNITGGGTRPQIVIVQRDSDDITLRDAQGGSGQLFLESDTAFTLDNPTDRIVLEYDPGLDAWCELNRSTAGT